MKLKILLFPLLLAVMIILSIWLIYPLWSNGLDGVKETRTIYKKEFDKLSVMKAKSQNIDGLFSAMTANASKKEAVVKYLPENINEEEIIDNLNFLASETGVSVLNISVSQPKEESLIASVLPMSGEPVAADAAPMAGVESQPVVIPPAKATNFDVKFEGVGDYGSIKAFLEKVYKYKRFNKLANIEIMAPTEENENKNALEATLTLNFDFFKKSSKAAIPEEPIFDKAAFDLKIVSEIENRSTEVLKLNVENQGRTNPFSL